jgi:hypothetical protein
MANFQGKFGRIAISQKNPILGLIGMWQCLFPLNLWQNGKM